MKRRRLPPWLHFAATDARVQDKRITRNYDPIRDGEPYVKKAKVAPNEPAQTYWGGGPNLPRARKGGRFWRLPGGGVWYKGNRP